MFINTTGPTTEPSGKLPAPRYSGVSPKVAKLFSVLWVSPAPKKEAPKHSLVLRLCPMGHALSIQPWQTVGTSHLLGQAVSSNSYTGNNLSVKTALFVCVMSSCIYKIGFILSIMNHSHMLWLLYHVYTSRFHMVSLAGEVCAFFLLHCIWPIILSHTSGKHETK